VGLARSDGPALRFSVVMAPTEPPMATLSSPLSVDVAIVGGGIVGMATALALLRRRPGMGVAVLEKEAVLGLHQTGRNSGVIHSGVYYRPGSLKASLCREGVDRLMAFCDDAGVAYETCGKVILATTEDERAALEELHRRGLANGVPGLRLIGPREVAEIEPAAARAVAGLHSPATGIVDYRQVLEAMAAAVRRSGGEIITGARVVSIGRKGSAMRLTTRSAPCLTQVLVNCAGLHADRVARMAGVSPGGRIVPFRGEYFTLRKDREGVVRGLIYPVPDPRFPFLGVHLTRHIHGGVHVGPNAVLAFAREGYRRTTIRPGELWDTLSFSGFRALARRFWRTGLDEYVRSFSRRAFAGAVQRLVPAVRSEDLVPAPSGVRAQAVTSDGRLVDDFWIARSPGAIHVLNVPSPAATASLAIGERIADMVEGAVTERAG